MVNWEYVKLYLLWLLTSASVHLVLGWSSLLLLRFPSRKQNWIWEHDCPRMRFGTSMGVYFRYMPGDKLFGFLFFLYSGHCFISMLVKIFSNHASWANPDRLENCVYLYWQGFCGQVMQRIWRLVVHSQSQISSYFPVQTICVCFNCLINM